MMNRETEPMLIFTDLDGTLLNHDDYNFDAAKPYLQKLRDNAIDVIPNTSKTAAELAAFRRAAALQTPFIVENGAAIYIPKDYFAKKPEAAIEKATYWVIENVQPRAHWQDILNTLPKAIRKQCYTFADAGLQGIMDMTGLHKESAELAMQREYGEPFQWQGNDADLATCLALLTAAGANVLKGGRFYHVSGACDKGSALSKLSGIYAQALNKTFNTLALGDSGNDIAMLNMADQAVVVHCKHYAPPQTHRTEKPYFTQQEAPQGWVEGVNYYLQLKN